MRTVITMNNDFKQHVLGALNKNVRIDGRGLEDYREIEIETGIYKTAEGSARVKIGDTEVLAGIKLLVETPFPDRPEEGTIMVSAELLPISNPEFESGPPGIDAIELARVVDRGIRESDAIDPKKLGIKKGEKCWIVSVDICPINDAGNLFDASALAAIAALKDARFPKYENDEIDYKTKTDKTLDMAKTPVSVTVLKVGNCLIVDPIPEEERAYDARLTVAVTEENNICALQKGGDGSISEEVLGKMVDLAINKSNELRAKL